MIELDGLTLVRGEQALFTGLSLTLTRERLALIGPNGPGKTSLLQVLSRTLPPTAGSVRVRLVAVGSISQGAADWSTRDSLRASAGVPVGRRADPRGHDRPVPA